MIFLYAVDNGLSYSDHTIYIFECAEPLEVIEAIVAAANSGGASNEWSVSAAGEYLRVLVPSKSYDFASFVYRAEDQAGYLDDGISAMAGVYERYPSLLEVRTAPKAGAL